MRLFSIVFLFLCAGHASAQNVVVVAAGGGGDAATLSGGVAQAGEGDVVLVRAGAYASDSVLVDSVGMSIVAEPGVTLDLHRFEIRNLSSGQFVLVRGLVGRRCEFVLKDCEGTMWLEDIDVFPSLQAPRAVIQALRCQNLVLSRCNLFGAHAGIGDEGADGVVASWTTLSAWDCAFGGGKGEGGIHGYDLDAGHGIVAAECTVLLGSSACIGGPGNGAAGGDGAVLVDSTLRHLNSTFTGAGGFPPGEDVRLHGDSRLIALDGTSRRIELSAPVRWGETLTLRLRGLEGDLVLLPHNLRPGGQYVDAGRGTFVIDPLGLLNFRLGRLPAGGVSTLEFTAPTVPGFEGLSFFAQGWFFDLQGVTLSAPSATVLLDPQF